MIDPKAAKFSRYDTADYLQTEDDITAYLEAVAEDGDLALIADAQEIVARARGHPELTPRGGAVRPRPATHVR
ncbi:helix-turn-helix domain-containing transcriptional regulator [Xylophilus sp.]|uniref:helix-turn-helix domain-containing transcriptional regulator n=1 Tax=Xylophilus sp. TaxID=2653893 RepID=UPI0013BABCA4|nr:hypothetical protein [Xylophilus sp.]KAF1041469.1 MAG: hypothetical protein GAK38_04569 [Xylophilus sp.]